MGFDSFSAAFWRFTGLRRLYDREKYDWEEDFTTAMVNATDFDAKAAACSGKIG